MKTIQTQLILAGIVAVVLGIAPAFGAQIPGEEVASAGDQEPPSTEERITVVDTTSLPSIAEPTTPPALKEPQTMRRMQVIVTAYSSTPEQTDDTPFITATGNYVRDGIVATNLLPFGTKIKIPTVYGDKIFVVDDRMHPRKDIHVDIWFPTYIEAKNFGVKNAYIEVLEG